MGLTLLAACGGGSPPVRVRPIAMNSELSATLSVSDPQNVDHGAYHVYGFTSSAGQNVQVDVISTEFDGFVMLQTARGVILGSANEGGEGTNARLVYVLPDSGNYQIVATSNQPGGAGNYRVRLTTLGGVRMITVGRPATGQLQPSDTRLPDNFRYQSFTYNARAAESVTIEAISTAFDPYVMVVDAGGARLASDDDSGEGTNARLTFTFPYQGAFRIYIGTYAANGAGAYTLAVR